MHFDSKPALIGVSSEANLVGISASCKVIFENWNNWKLLSSNCSNSVIR